MSVGDPRVAALRRDLASARDDAATQRALASLRELAEEGLPEAMLWLGNCHQYGMALPWDPDAAAALYRRAADAGDAGGLFRLAELVAMGLSDAGDLSLAEDLYRQAWDAGHAGAACQLAYLLDQGLGCEAAPAAATALLHAAARAGSARAMLWLAERLQRGDTVQVLPEHSLRWAERAAAAGYPLAADLARALRAAGHRAAEEDGELTIDADRHLPLDTGTTAYSESPRILGVRGAASLAERAHMIASAMPLIRPSQVVRVIGGDDRPFQGRTSGEMAFQRGYADVVVRRYIARISTLVGLPPDHSEPMVVLHYRTGAEYTPHYDFLGPRHAEALADGGQRRTTVLGYLNDVPGGGSTEFPLLGIDARPVGGEGLLFDNLDERGKPDERTLHAGRPVTQGEKWMATLWFRVGPVRSSGAA